ncbi:MAG TPA: HAMP domain-containing sensor histidine kinase [Trebonia sp.]|nr:HAMP domain-containing sensor histidine kinase [Trebonia sp.]
MTPDAPLAPDEPEITSSRVDPAPPRPPGHPRARLRSLRRLSERTPLRTKLITAVLALVIAALAVISIASVLILRPYLYTQRDSDLQLELTHMLRYGGGQGRFLEGSVGTDSGFIAAVQAPGQQLPPTYAPFGGFGMPTRPKLALPALPTGNWSNPNDPVTLTQPGQSGDDMWRVMGITVPAVTSAGVQTNAPLLVAVDLGPVSQEIHRLIAIELGVGTAIVIVVALAGVAIVRTNLRPLNDIELTAGQIAAGHLNHRIAERDPRTEIGSLGRSLNAMLSQIETAFHAQQESEEAAHRSEERMRRFIADASHELRTPLTTLRGFAEFYRQRGGVQPDGMAPEELDRIMRRLESEASRMGLLVEDLLQLARLDQQRPLDIHPVDLLTLAADAVQDARIVAPDRTIELTVAPGAAFLVEGDEPRLRQVIGNLVTNARTHTPPEASITVSIAPGTLETGAPAVVLDVIDDGHGMTAEQAQHIFERFYRADAARNRASGGTGLGLAIVAGLVTAHGGEVSVQTAPGQGADFRVKLPLSTDALYADEPADDFVD